MPVGLGGQASPSPHNTSLSGIFLFSDRCARGATQTVSRPLSRSGRRSATATLLPHSLFMPYLRPLLEHLGKARGLGDVKRHGLCR